MTRRNRDKELERLFLFLTGVLAGVVLCLVCAFALAEYLTTPHQTPQDGQGEVYPPTPVQITTQKQQNALETIVERHPTPLPYETPAGVGGSLEIALLADPMVIEFEDRERLAWLVWVEARGMEEVYWTAALSVIGTVYHRMDRQILSRGSVRSTLLWCSDGNCQFPAWVANLGCDGISLCPVDYPPQQLIIAREAVNLYALGWRGSCDGYLFYGSRRIDGRDCELRSQSGQYIRFYEGKWNRGQ